MRSNYQTTSGKGLNRDSLPMRLWEKAKIYGIWNPASIDFSQDKIDFEGLNKNEKEFVMQTISQFQAGEEAVTLDLLPLIMAVAKEGRLEEEMFLTSFLWEEAKHVDGFNRFINEVTDYGGVDITDMLVPSYKLIFNQLLPDALDALKDDPSPVNQVIASTTYNMIVEGVLAETGYYGLFQVLDEQQMMPGLRKFVGKLKQDESRHIAYGIYLISRLVAENGEEVWQAFNDQMNKLLMPAMQVVTESYAKFEVVPFGINQEELTNYAMGQFQKRLARIQKARNQSIEELNLEVLETV